MITFISPFIHDNARYEMYTCNIFICDLNAIANVLSMLADDEIGLKKIFYYLI